MKRAGLLTQIIKVLSPSSTTNSFGELIQTFTPTYRTRARVDHQSGNREIENNEIYYAYTKTFQVRSYVPVTEKDLIEYKGKRYRIITIEDRKEDENDKILTTEQINE